MSAQKWLFAGVLSLLIVSAAMADPPATHPTTGEPLVIDCLRGTPEAIDGDLSDWNLDAMTPAVLDSSDQIYTGTWGGVDDCSGLFYVLWDDLYLYMAVIVKDDALSMTKTDGDIWNADCIEVFFATTDYVPTGDHTGHYQYGFNANGQTWNWCNMDSGGQTAIDYLTVASTETDDGYICEAAIEYGQITALDWSVGSDIGFHPCIDDTEATDREIQMTWTGREAHDQSLGFGYLVLSDKEAIAPEVAKDPSPAHEAVDVPLDATLSWTAGDFAVTHDVYLGTSFDDVNDGTTPTSAGQTATTYDPGLLDWGQTYYWRVDEVNGAPDNTVFKGLMWNFTTELYAYPITGIIATSNGIDDGVSTPQKAVDGSGLNAAGAHSTEPADMWLASAGAEPLSIQFEFDKLYKLNQMVVWNYNSQFEMVLGFGLKDVTVEYSENGTDWTVLGDAELARAPGVPTYTADSTVDFGDVSARFVKLTANSSWGMMGQFGLSEVQFLAIPVQAREPQPADAAADVDVTSTLAWRSGRDAVSHDVYFGTDPDALALAGTADGPAFNPGELDLGATYYWQVTEVLDAESWQGSLWSFSTQDYLVIDDFEAYNDEDNLIYEAWLDGFANETGSTVGYFEAPFAEQTIVYGGRQSMPLFYENDGVSTAEADLELGQNWTTNGIKSLSLYFYGDATNTEAQLYAKINNTRIDYSGPAVDLTRPSWQLWNIDLAAVGNVNNVSKLTIGIEGAGAEGVLYIDDIRLYPYALDASASDITGAGDIVQGVPNDGDWPAAEYPDLAIDDDTATKFLHFKGFSQPTGFQVTPLAGPSIVTSLTFTTANDAVERDPVAFELYGSNDSIDGPYTLIASGDIVDFAMSTAWPRFTKNATPIVFDNDVAYSHYQVLFTAVRDPDSANSMQIAEVEFIGELAP